MASAVLARAGLEHVSNNNTDERHEKETDSAAGAASLARADLGSALGAPVVRHGWRELVRR